jgi:hypothetical protein
MGKYTDLTPEQFKTELARLLQLYSKGNKAEAEKLIAGLFIAGDKLDLTGVSSDWEDEVRELTAAAMEGGLLSNAQTISDIEKGVKDGAGLFNAVANIVESKRQIREGKEAADALVDPAAPAARTQDRGLQEATEAARRDKYQRPRELDAYVQRNIDLLNENMGIARTASTGQASTYGALGQNAINQARRANMASIPQMAAIQRQKDAQYNDLVKAGVTEQGDIARTNLALYNQQNQKYLAEAEAAGGAIASGRYNLAASRQGLGQHLGTTAGTLGQLGGMIGRGKGDSDNGPTNTGRLTTPNVLNGGYNALSGQGPAPQFGQTTSILNRGYNALSGIGPEYSQYAEKVNNSLQSHLDPAFTPTAIPRSQMGLGGYSGAQGIAPIELHSGGMSKADDLLGNIDNSNSGLTWRNSDNLYNPIRNIGFR